MNMKLAYPFITDLKRIVASQNTLGLIVMNLSELIQIKGTTEPGQREAIRAKQRKLSQVTDMIHSAHIFHRCVQDHKLLGTTEGLSSDNITETKRLHRDNVLALLVGDYLLAQSSVDMADLRYPATVGLIAKGLEDYTRGEFLRLQLVENFEKKLSTNPQDVYKGVSDYAQLTCGSLLSNACLSAALLAGHQKIDDDIVCQKNSDTNCATIEIKKTSASDNFASLVYSFGFHAGTAHRLIEMLYCPDTNSEDDRNFIKSLDVKMLNESLVSHVDKSVHLLNKLPDVESRISLFEMLAEMRSRCQAR